LNNRELLENFAKLSTPLVADAALRLRLALHIAPFGIRPAVSGTRLAGHTAPVKHFGSVEAARKIWQTERKQAELIKTGQPLRQQLKFAEYLKKRAIDSDYTFRQHLREIGGAIEE
jgi:hypothetical protein